MDRPRAARAALVLVLCVLALALALRSRRPAAPEPLRWSESRSGELRDALASAAAPAFDAEPVPGGFTQADFEPSPGDAELGLDASAGPWSGEGPDAFPPLSPAAASHWDMPRLQGRRACR